MTYCTECGARLEDDAKYCKSCGKKITIDGTQKLHEKAKTMVCPQCGDLINSFTGKCPSCGAEFFGFEASKSVMEFSNNISKATTFEQKLDMIKTFPIPNTKEDIIEYMILAASNIGYTDRDGSIKEEYEDAWITKFMQGYQKAKLIFENDPSFEKIQTLYHETMARIDNIENGKTKQKIIDILLKNMGVFVGAVIAIIAVWIDITGGNSSLMELIAIILFIASACTLKKEQRNT